jgi:hypothetical protein
LSKKKFLFEVITVKVSLPVDCHALTFSPQGKSWLISADSEEIKQSWIAALKY